MVSQPYYLHLYFFFIYLRGVSGDRRTHRGSNPGRGRNKSHELTTTVKPSSAGYTRELEPGHSGRAKPAKATELQAPCVYILIYIILTLNHEFIRGIKPI